MNLDAGGQHYKKVNEDIHAALEAGNNRLNLENVRGQRYLGCGLGSRVDMTINGVPGNDLASFMNGARIEVMGNAQDAVGNTMNAGLVLVHGAAGDIVGYGMRGGRIYIQGDVGYRAGIHMKAFEDNYPIVVVGGSAQDYFGEYMAGGVLVVLNMQNRPSPVGHFVGTGMHGGKIFIRGKVEDWQVGAEVGFAKPSDEEWDELEKICADYYDKLGLKPKGYGPDEFIKLYPKSARPYGNLYSY
jgi:glutamate synthase domain-containing protein 3